MKNFFVLILAVCYGGVFAQTKIEKTIPVQAGSKLKMIFDYPEIIRLHTWDKDHVVIRGEVSINNGANDDSFEIDVQRHESEIRVESLLKDEANIPHYIVIHKGEMDYYFKAQSSSDPEVQKFLSESNGQYTYMSEGILREIKLEIFVPANTATEVDAKYGIVEVTDFHAPLRIDAKYGAVDVTLAPQTAGELSVRTKFGEILTNLDVMFNSQHDSDNRWTAINATLGQGSRYELETKYGKVYLRKG